MRVDLLYHYVGGACMSWFGEAILHLNKIDNTAICTTLMIGKELTDATGFDVLDLAFGIAGLVTQIW
jgi:hypothetical protein